MSRQTKFFIGVTILLLAIMFGFTKYEANKIEMIESAQIGEVSKVLNQGLC